MLALFALFLVSQVVLNEVMANPSGRETGTGAPGRRNEFVEIFNNTSETVNLTGWKLGDDERISPLIPFPDSSILELYPNVVLELRLPPEGYAVVLDRDYLDVGNGSYPQPYELPPGTVVLSVEGSSIGDGLANDDPLFLLDEVDDTVDEYPAGFNPPDGVSMERRLPELDEWLLSRNGCTPGARNSVSVRYDAALILDGLAVSPNFPQPFDEITLSFNLVNFGIYEIGDVRICSKFAERTRCLPSEVIAPNETTSLQIDIGAFDEGTVEGQLFLTAESDEIPSNDTIYISFSVGISELILNEILYSGTSEWIELYNRSGRMINVEGVSVRDRSGKRSEGCPDFGLEGHGFLVLTGDSTFCTSNPTINCLYLKDFPVLNNSSEDVVIMNSVGIPIDSVSYSSGWGGRDGRSLERITDQVPGWDRYNWTESTSPSGSTPGTKNSVSVSSETPRSGELFGFSSRIISSSDGIAVLNYQLPNVPATVKIMVFNEIGQQAMPTFVKNVSTPTGQIFLDVRSLKRGLYILLFEAVDYDGAVLSQKKTFSVR
ncbi:MAG: hypothetical protein DRQ10_00655 [Candidatus Hydrothermota bacterium]|nr:MAG: hypothetical protein DRQ10_00655 [Candidatus Hydrothermae bacterium]